MKRITVFGSATPLPSEPLWEVAERTGEALASAGLGLVNGGYGGTMEAAAVAAKRANGHVTAVTLTDLDMIKPVNSFSDETIVAHSLFERLEILLRLGDGYIVLPGATGTLVEWALAWELGVKGFAPPKPVAMVGDFWLPVVECVQRDSSIPPGARATPRERLPLPPTWIFFVETPEEAVDRIKKMLVK